MTVIDLLVVTPLDLAVRPRLPTTRLWVEVLSKLRRQKTLLPRTFRPRRRQVSMSWTIRAR